MNDQINGAFEALSGLMILLHCRSAWRAKDSRSVSLIATIFFFLWGAWNIHFYPTLGQTWSFYGGLVVFGANLLWLSLIIFYRRPRISVKAD